MDRPHLFADFHKRRIAATLPSCTGSDTDEVMAAVESAMQHFWQASELEARIQGVALEGRTLILTLKHHSPKLNPKTGRLASAGAPRKEALRDYVTSLVTIYQHATGKRITRIVDAYARGQREKPHPFIAACMKAAGTGYPSGLVRQVLAQKKAE